ncbi:hypothetical protein [Stappia indica]|uniref:Uncharacterized protein n=1 Tax=Stappia indica TaxID=538381 RepID=A0A285S7Z4_9HYPH|nr:hypothetical protein [Stappia indica]MCC4245671.1 hypothetical protein [Stappia indica]SOC03529.1 hypothetical protein SAMN05421512_104161 [Stappia indica]
MRGIAALGLGGLAAIAISVAIGGLNFGPGHQINTAQKGDRMARTVQVACAAGTMQDAAQGCADLARSIDPAAAPAWRTIATRDGTTTVLARSRVSE